MSKPTRRGFLKGVLGVIAGGAAVATTAKADVPKLPPAVPEDVKWLEGASYPSPEETPREHSLYEANTYSMKLMVSDEELAEAVYQRNYETKTMETARRLKRAMYQRADEDAIRILKEGFDE